jgi:hypothetical protein
MRQPDPANLLQRIGLAIPLIGFYDVPDISPFEPLVKPKKGRRACVFAFYNQWLKKGKHSISPGIMPVAVGHVTGFFTKRQGHGKTSSISWLMRKG